MKSQEGKCTKCNYDEIQDWNSMRAGIGEHFML